MSLSKWQKIRIAHPNSVDAYYEGLLSNLFSSREKEIIDSLEVLGRVTDRDIMEYLGYTDMNQVRPRITELINKAGLLEEIGFTHDPATDKKVRIIRIKVLEDKRQLTLF